MGVFSLPPTDIPSLSTIASMHMVSFVNCGPHRTPDPWKVPSCIDVDQHGEHVLSLVEENASFAASSIPPNAGQKLHPNMEYDQDPFPTWVVPPPLPRDSLDDDSSLQLVVSKVMESPIDHPKGDYVSSCH